MLYNISDLTAATRFYSEVSYLPLSIFVAVPLFFDVIPSLLSWPKATPASQVPFGNDKIKMWPSAMTKLVTVLLLLRLATIAWNHRTVAGQYAWIEKQVDRPGNRFLLPLEQVPMDTVLLDWGVPFTAMHLTALKSPDSAKTLLLLPDFQWFEDKMGKEDVFFSPFHKVLEKGDLNHQYYRMQPGKYQLLD
jgi:hypothetical protein